MDILQRHLSASLLRTEKLTRHSMLTECINRFMDNKRSQQERSHDLSFQFTTLNIKFVHWLLHLFIYSLIFIESLPQVWPWGSPWQYNSEQNRDSSCQPFQNKSIDFINIFIFIQSLIKLNCIYSLKHSTWSKLVLCSYSS